MISRPQKCKSYNPEPPSVLRENVKKKLCEEEIALKPLTSTSNELLIRFDSQTYEERMGYNMTIEKGIIYCYHILLHNNKLGVTRLN